MAKKSRKASPKKLRPPVKWHGGKYYLCRQIIEYFPDHHTYVEPFGGSASVLLNKLPSVVEVYNDLDERITRLFRVIRDDGERLGQALALTPYSEIEFKDASQKSTDEMEQARRDFVRWRLSLGGRGDSFSFTLHRVRRQMADVVSGYLSSIDEQLPLIIERLRTVQIVSRPAVEVIKKWDNEKTLFYCDPPYVKATREKNSRDIYGYEMTDDEHIGLANTLKKANGLVVVSGYPSDLYESLFKDWNRIDVDIANHAAGGKKKTRETESLWLNFDPGK